MPGSLTGWLIVLACIVFVVGGGITILHGAATLQTRDEADLDRRAYGAGKSTKSKWFLLGLLILVGYII